VLVLGAVGAVGGVGAGARAGAGGGRVAVCAGAAGGARRAGRGFGASTVSCGTVTVGPAPLCGVSGAPCCGCTAGASPGGVCGDVVAGGACGAGVDGWVSGAVVAGGASGAGVCDEATPVKQTSMSAELLSSSKRRLRIHITRPPMSNFDPSRRKQRRARHRRHLAAARPLAGSMSDDGRPACLEDDAVRRRHVDGDGGLESRAGENLRQRHRRRLGGYQCAGEMDQAADRAEIVGKVFMIGTTGRRAGLLARQLRARPRRNGVNVLEMHVRERDRELERQREQRQIRPQPRPRPEETHWCRLRASRAAEPFRRRPRRSNNVTLSTIGPDSRFRSPVAETQHRRGRSDLASRKWYPAKKASGGSP
jgi:hypothetical protein